MNDFDETAPGPFEWDIKRLVTSFVIAGRDNNFSREDCARAALEAARSYRTAICEYAEMTSLAVYDGLARVRCVCIHPWQLLFQDTRGVGHGCVGNGAA